mmetsp:Transcript_99721/g.307621  ORF Transcript_99721/g.307621 Transcript_99721/m.307621 type:complete len:252 (+) Transcript_99721:274-1029(+)
MLVGDERGPTPPSRRCITSSRGAPASRWKPPPSRRLPPRLRRRRLRARPCPRRRLRCHRHRRRRPRPVLRQQRQRRHPRQCRCLHRQRHRCLRRQRPQPRRRPRPAIRQRRQFRHHRRQHPRLRLQQRRCLRRQRLQPRRRTASGPRAATRSRRALVGSSVGRRPRQSRWRSCCRARTQKATASSFALWRASSAWTRRRAASRTWPGSPPCLRAFRRALAPRCSTPRSRRRRRASRQSIAPSRSFASASPW